MYLCILPALSISCNKPSSTDNGTPKDILPAGWTLNQVNSQQFTNIHFVQNNGIAVSTTGIYGSSDGGSTWQQRSTYGNGAFGIGYAWRRNIGMDGIGNVVVPQGLMNTGVYFIAMSHDYINFSVVADPITINDSYFIGNNAAYAITANN
jgi:hypothetical protein